MTPDMVYRRYGTINTNQYHKLINELYNWEIAIDEFIQKWDFGEQ